MLSSFTPKNCEGRANQRHLLWAGVLELDDLKLVLWHWAIGRDRDVLGGLQVGASKDIHMEYCNPEFFWIEFWYVYDPIVFFQSHMVLSRTNKETLQFYWT